MRVGSRSALWVVLAGAGACGNVGGIPIDQTASDIAAAVCPKAWSCCTADQLANNTSAGTSEADCETQTAATFRNSLMTLQRSVDQKRAIYQSSKLDTCLDTIRTSSCDTLNMTSHLAGIPACASFATPLVAVGGACSQDYECVGGWCNVPANSTNGEGVCAAVAAQGQSCAEGHGPSCAAGLVCDPEGTIDDNSDDLCEPFGGAGAVCQDQFQCQSGNCTSSGGSGMTCGPATSAMCFYSSGCSAAGDRPGTGTVILFVAFALVGLLRARRSD